MNRYPSYKVEWSEGDEEFVATCDWFPSLSFLARDCVDALSGLADLILEEFGEEGLVARRQLFEDEARRVHGERSGLYGF